MQPPALEPRLAPRPHAHLGIGIIGAGGIVSGAHLPAYRGAGFNVVALSSRNLEKLDTVASQFGIAHRYADYRSLLDNPQVDVVDIAIPGEGRLEVVRDVATAGKHMLVQKPLANDLKEAAEMVRLAKAAGVRLAVNQNARWAPSYRAAWWLIRQGFVGEVYDVVHDMRGSQDSESWFIERWYAREERYQIIQYSIHHLDLVRFWLGREPDWVLANSARKPGQNARGEMSADILLNYGPHLSAAVRDRNACFPESEPVAKFVIEGTDGHLEGDALAGTLRARHRGWPGEVWQVPLEGSWFPNAFAYTMSELLDAVTESRQPTISGEDNLHSLALVEAAYQSLSTHAAVSPAALLSSCQ